VPRRGYRTQPRVSTLGIVHQERRALKGAPDRTSQRYFPPPQKIEDDDEGRLFCNSCNSRFLNLRNAVTPYPTGRNLWGGGCPRHFVPGYDRIVPPGHFATGFSQDSGHRCSPFFGASGTKVPYRWLIRIVTLSFPNKESGAICRSLGSGIPKTEDATLELTNHV
jgi:hypothetical protein